LFAELETICRDDAILATNTSALDLDAMAQGLRKPERFVGLHFFSPANVMKLVEIVDAAATAPATLAAAVAVAKRIGKVPVVSGNCDGFIGNRMVAKRGAQVDRLLQEGASPAQVDAALKHFGFPMGPLAINDMSGLDIGYSIRKRRGTKFPIADAVVESGRLGQKTGRGYYRYEEGSRTPLPDPEIDALIASVSTGLGFERREIGAEEMVERMIFPLINEGARILEEGIARRASDIDVVWINGYGFPRWRGGPMFHADETGLAHIVARLRDFAKSSGDASLEPATLLVDLAETNSTFSAWDRARSV
jgi:3-hydroxyacyl-CoA dehydrogenase